MDSAGLDININAARRMKLQHKSHKRGGGMYVLGKLVHSRSFPKTEVLAKTSAKRSNRLSWLPTLGGTAIAHTCAGFDRCQISVAVYERLELVVLIDCPPKMLNPHSPCFDDFRHGLERLPAHIISGQQT